MNLNFFFSGVSRCLRSVAVMVTSSAWHGVYFGYYLSLGSVPFVLAVEDLYEKILRRKLSNAKVYDFVAWFMRFQWFSYLGEKIISWFHSFTKLKNSFCFRNGFSTADCECNFNVLAFNILHRTFNPTFVLHHWANHS